VKVKRRCDEYIDDESAPAVLRRYLKRARSPAHGLMSTDPFPRLFADYDGRRVRIVMASRMGHVGITSNLQVEYGYEEGVFMEDLSHFSDEP
jgi:hypothetical protein